MDANAGVGPPISSSAHIAVPDAPSRQSQPHEAALLHRILAASVIDVDGLPDTSLPISSDSIPALINVSQPQHVHPASLTPAAQLQPVDMGALLLSSNNLVNTPVAAIAADTDSAHIDWPLPDLDAPALTSALEVPASNPEHSHESRNKRDREAADKRNQHAPNAKKKRASAEKENSIEDEDDSDSNCCSICLEQWNNTGPHHLCCLPCGHLFGSHCIETWLSKKKQCPTCKHPARVKEIRLIFGAPAQLAVLDQGELDNVKKQLTNEKAAHQVTQRKLADARQLAAVYQRALQTAQYNRNRRSSTPHRNHALPRSSPSVYPPVVWHPANTTTSRVAQFARPTPGNAGPGALTTQTTPTLPRTAVSDDSVAQLFSRTNSAPQRMPQQQLQQQRQQPSAPQPQRLRRGNRVSCIGNVSTMGGSRALAFDERGNVLFSENSPSFHGGGQRIVRAPCMSANIRTPSRMELNGMIKDMSICRLQTSACYSYVAAPSTARKLHILSDTLEHVMVYDTQAIPLSCSWMSSQPHLIVTGLLNGVVCAYDVRVNSRTPLYAGKVNGPHSNAVHSLAETSLYGTSGSVLLAAAPSRIDAITFGDYAGGMQLEEVRRDGPGRNEHCCGLTVDGNFIMLSSLSSSSDDSSQSSGLRNGRHVIHRGIVPVANLNEQFSQPGIFGPGASERTLHFGQHAMGTSLDGHRVRSTMAPGALIVGDPDTGEGTIVMSGHCAPDRRVTRAWEYSSSVPSNQSRPRWSWTDLNPCASQSQNMIVRSYRRRPNSNFPSNHSRPFVVSGHLGENYLHLFAVDQRHA